MWWCLTLAWAGEGVVAYNDRLVAETQRILEQTQQLQRVAPPANPADLEPYRLGLRTILVGFRDESAALPAFEGDSSFRDALVSQAQTLVDLVDHPTRTFLELSAAPAAKSEDVGAADVAYRAMMDGAAASDAALHKAQADFAARHHLTLVATEPPPEVARGPEFECPEIVPAGITLPAGWIAGKTVAYYNGFVEDANALVDAMNLVVTSSGGEGLDAARLASLERIEALAVTTASRGDWLGDDTLLVGMTELETQSIEMLRGTVLRMVRAEARGMRSQADVDAFNALIVDLNEALPAAMDHWGSAVVGFQSHWHMDEFGAWQAEHAAWEAAHRAGMVAPTGLTAPAAGGVGAPAR
ncbi:hypothetical protein LBMAG42_18920 [Deltaproteobacteria bacterium]|nr:hypothetical protein LBMAG42_18920 [Deltaproteobacteria bacterium]